MHTNPMLHKEPYINCSVFTLAAHAQTTTSVTIQMHTFALQIGRVTNRLLHSEMEHLNWQTSGSFALWGRVYNNVCCTKL